MTQIIITFALLGIASECGRRALVGWRRERLLSRALGVQCSDLTISPASAPAKGGLLQRISRSLRAVSGGRSLAVGAGLLIALIAQKVLGPLGFAIGLITGPILSRALLKRQALRLVVELEKQLAEVAESTAMAVRSGLSVTQGLAFATEETAQPMSEHLDRMQQELGLGAPFDESLHRFADGIGSPDAKLFALVVSIHAKSGGNLAGALDEVSNTIRHRIAVRRELRALSAQGRISGSVLGALPIAFFVVLAVTSHRELSPIYRSSLGIAMISVGLLMEGLAFLWIRRLLRVEP